MRPPKRKTLLIFSQTFVPDPASVGQYVADAAFEMARRGHRVVVYTANRGYEDTSARYPDRETLNGVDVRRLGLSSFGKNSLLTRIVGTASFLIQCTLIGLFTPELDAILFSTSPPMIGLAGSLIRWVRRVPAAYWAMDLNPDQLIALGTIAPRGPVARILELLNRLILHSASLVVVLDRFMASRLAARADVAGKMIILPPWAQEDYVESLPHEANPFRAQHGLTGKFVVMYSGNHSPSNPLATLLEAAFRLKDEPGIQFLFVGGGIGKKEVEAFVREHRLPNVSLLPYQPFSELRYSLSAADLHVVSLGDALVGVVHPCKVYGAMAVSRPVLFLGPSPSHIADLLERHPFGVRVAHGDAEGAVKHIQAIRQMSPEQLREMGQAGQSLLGEQLGQDILRARFCDHLQRLLIQRKAGRA